MAEPAAPGVPVYNPEGELVTIPKLDQTALMHGYRAATPEDVHAAQAEQQYGGIGQGLAAFGEGAASALSFGITPKLEVEAGITTPEAIAGRQEANPIWHGAGTIAGVAAPLIATLGASAPESAAAAAAAGAGEATGAGRLLAAARGAAEYTAPGLISKAGAAARAAAEGAGLPGIIGRAAPTLAAGAVEGALYAGQDVTEKTLLGDPQMTWEKAASEMGLGALFGGALAGGTEVAAKGLGYAINKASQGLEAVGKRLATGDREMVNLVLKSKDDVSAFEKEVPGVTDSLMNSDPENFRWMMKNREKIAEYTKEFPGLTDILANQTVEANQKILDLFPARFRDQVERDAAGMAQGKILNEAFTSTESALADANRTVRPAEVAMLAGQVDPAVANAEAARVRDLMVQKIGQLEQKPATYGTQVPGKLKEMVRELDQAAGKDPAEVFKALNAAKKQIQNASKFELATPTEQRAAIAEIRSLGHDVRTALEKEEVWGKAGARQREFNAAEAEYLSAKKRLTKRLFEKPEGVGGPTEAADTKVNTWLNKPTSAKGQSMTATFGRYIRASRAMADQMEQSGAEGAGALRAQLEGIEKATKEIQERATVSYLIKAGQGPQMISSGAPIPLAHQIALGAAKRIPGGVGHIVALAHGTLGRARDPATLVKVLSFVNKAAEKTSKALDSGVSGIFGGVGSAASGGAAEKLAPSAVTPESFASVSGNLHDYSGNLDRLAQDVSSQTDGLAPHAPSTAAAATAFAGRVVQHLSSKIPQSGQQLPLDAPFSPSATELATYNRHHEIAERGPVAVLRHIAQGTLTPEHLETSQVLYPKLHQEAQARVVEALSEKIAAKETIPYDLRLQLALFLGYPLEQSMTPEAILSAQSTYAAVAGQPQGAPDGAPAGKLARNVNTEFGQRLATSTQGVTQRMAKGA